MGSFNFFRLCGDYTHLIAMTVLLVGLLKRRNARTVSLRSQQLYLTVYLLRYLDLLEVGAPTSLHNTLFKVCFISITVATIVMVRFYSNDTWPKEHDSWKWFYVIAPSVAYGIFGMLSSGLMSVPWNYFVWFEFFWTVSQGLEIFAIFPQAWLIYKKQNGQQYVVWWLALMFAYRFLYCLNWGYRHLTENKFDHISIFSGVTQVLAFFCLFIYTLTVNKRRIRVNPEDKDIEFSQFDPAAEDYAWLRNGGSDKGVAIL